MNNGFLLSITVIISYDKYIFENASVLLIDSFGYVKRYVIMFWATKNYGN